MQQCSPYGEYEQIKRLTFYKSDACELLMKFQCRNYPTFHTSHTQISRNMLFLSTLQVYQSHRPISHTQLIFPLVFPMFLCYNDFG